MKYTLRVVRDPVSGETGLCLKDVAIDDMPMVDVDGYNIAHDIVEHVNGTERIGEIADELVALGAMWYVRGRWGDLRRDGAGSMHSPESHLAADVTRMQEDMENGTPLWLPHLPSRQLPMTRASEADPAIDSIMREAEVSEDSEYGRAVRALMRTGYSKAKRKYESRGRFFANSLFWGIQEAVADAHKHHELIEGMTLILTVVGTEARVEEPVEEYY